MLPWLLYSHYYTGLFYPISGRAVRLIALDHAVPGQSWYLDMLGYALLAVGLNNTTIWTIALIAIAIVIVGIVAYPDRRAVVSTAARIWANRLVVPLAFGVAICLAYGLYIFGVWFFEKVHASRVARRGDRRVSAHGSRGDRNAVEQARSDCRFARARVRDRAIARGAQIPTAVPFDRYHDYRLHESRALGETHVPRRNTNRLGSIRRAGVLRRQPRRLQPRRCGEPGLLSVTRGGSEPRLHSRRARRVHRRMARQHGAHRESLGWSRGDRSGVPRHDRGIPLVGISWQLFRVTYPTESIVVPAS